MGVYCKYTGLFKVVAKKNENENARVNEALVQLDCISRQLNADGEKTDEDQRVWNVDIPCRRMNIIGDDRRHFVNIEAAFPLFIAAIAPFGCELVGEIYEKPDVCGYGAIGVYCARGGELKIIPEIKQVVKRMSVADIDALCVTIDKKRDEKNKKYQH